MERHQAVLSRRGWIVAAADVLAHPRLWPTAVVEARRMVPPAWWRRWPPLPVPDRDYLRFRMQTAYGDPQASPPAEDVVAWLRWCRQWPGRAR
jgi:hypothetical protein